MNDYRTEIAKLRDKAMELSGRGSEMAGKVQPAISSANERWQSFELAVEVSRRGVESLSAKW